MAHKRMFSKDITGSDAFLDMPASSQALYFHLGMEADDDGFIGNPKKVMRSLGVNGADDIKILLGKRFLLEFPSGVVVVKHHRINNNWDKYNCKRTTYLEEFSQLYLKENKAYTLDESQGVPVQSERRLETVFRIEENRIDNSSVAEAPLEVVIEDENAPRKKSDGNKYTKSYKELCDWMEGLTGVSFVDRRGQYKALKLAREASISKDRLKGRAEEIWSSGRYEKDGMDWFTVVYSFNKKA